jgi:hypothetical protein
VREQTKCPGELFALRGQVVGGTGRSLDVQPGHDQRVALEPLESLRQDVRRDPRNLRYEVVETPRSGEQCLNDEQGPTITHPNESLGEWRGRPLSLSFRHGQTVSVEG